jgi:hypothetical protein
MCTCKFPKTIVPALTVALLTGVGAVQADSPFSSHVNNHPRVEQQGGTAGTTCSYQLASEDGTAENSIGLTAGGDIAWANHFTAAVGCEIVEVVSISWGVIPNGSPAQVYILSDPNGDGNPNDSAVLATANVVVANSDTDTFNSYPVAPTIVSGSFFVAARAPHAAGQFPANIDQTAPNGGMSWAAFGFADINSPFSSGGTVGTIDSFGLPGDWTMRGLGNLGNACTLPLGPCAADVAPAPNGDNVVNVSDLLAVIATWGQDGNPNGPRPQGDAAPLPNGDCIVNVTDLLAVISGWGPCPEITGACCASDTSCSQATAANCAAAGSTYQGDNTDCASVVCPTPPPPNDVCEKAQVISCGETVTLTDAQQAAYTVEGTDPTNSCWVNSGSFALDRSWWYELTTGSQAVTLDISACGSDPANDVVIGVWQGTCGGTFTEVACDDDTCTAPAFGPSDLPTFTLCSNTTYYVVVQHYSGSPAGAFSMSVSACTAADANDNCSCPDTLAIPSTTTGTLATATGDAAPSCGGDIFTGRWYTLMGNGQNVTITSCNSPLAPMDGRLAVYCGLNCDSLFCVASANNNTCGFNQETVTFCATAGQQFWVLYHSDGPEFHPYQLDVTGGPACGIVHDCGLPPPPPANDECTAAATLVLGNNAVDNTSATSSQPAAPGGTGSCGASDCAIMGLDVWYVFDPPAAGQYLFNLCGNTEVRDHMLQVLDGTCTSLTHIAGDDDFCGGGGYPQVLANLPNADPVFVRYGNWCSNWPTCTGTSGIPGPANLVITQVATVCGNGIQEPGEECDSNVPPGGCVACELVPVCPVGCDATEAEVCTMNVAGSNGGCNNTPPAFPVTLVAGNTFCGTTWANDDLVAGTPNRDTDWLLYTVGASGRVRVDFKSAIPTASFLITSGTTCPATATAGLGWSDDNACAVYQVNNLTPGSQVVVFVGAGNADGSGVFNGFPCGGPDGNNYEITVTSP